MVHAEASTFAEGLSKSDIYAQILEQAKALFEGQRNWVWYVYHRKHLLLSSINNSSYPKWTLLIASSNLANTSSLLYHGLRSLPASNPSSHVNWAGFYVLDPSTANQLILGPFHGQVACQTIPLGRGVCGTAAATKVTQLVPDVESFPGHIACDGASKSEIVVPIVQNGKLVAIIDIDCAELDGFGEEDRGALEELAGLIAGASDF